MQRSKLTLSDLPKSRTARFATARRDSGYILQRYGAQKACSGKRLSIPGLRFKGHVADGAQLRAHIRGRPRQSNHGDFPGHMPQWQSHHGSRQGPMTPGLPGSPRTHRTSHRRFIEEVQSASKSSDPEALTNTVANLRQTDGVDGLWEIFLALEKEGCLHLLSRDNAAYLRDEILTSALSLHSRLVLVLDAAHRLSSDFNLKWPNLYTKVMFYMLDHDLLEDSIRWHFQLMPHFPPSAQAFGELLSTFVIDPSPRMQSTLTSLYVANPDRCLYDQAIPILFAAGLSNVARAWRKKFLLFQDTPTTSKCRAFLRFLAFYYPSIPLTGAELAIAELGGVADKDQSRRSRTNRKGGSSQYSDSVVARWFASSWASTEFAISFAQRLGLRVIGPRALQSLALREPGAKSLLSCIDQAEKLGLQISPQTYCKVLVFFAKHGKDALLADLVACDIHPDEFDGMETRQMLLASSIRQGDWRRERFLQGIEWAVEMESSSHGLNAILGQHLARHRLDRARQTLDRMDASKVTLDQKVAAHLLQNSFLRLGKHSWKRRRHNKEHCRNLEALLNKAIDVARRIALHDIPIPLRYWKLLLWNLGRLGQLDKLEQLCEELVQLYSPQMGGLIPTHSEDLPRIYRGSCEVLDEGAQELAYPIGSKQSTDTPVSFPEMTVNPKITKANGFNAYKTTKWWKSFENLESPCQMGPHSLSMVTEDVSVDTSGYSPTDQKCQQDYIPADLPFTHRQHPLQIIFDSYLQRSIIRWGFDQNLRNTPCPDLTTDPETSVMSGYDIASGVRLLARLRDRGILIDLQILRTTVLSKIALSRMRGHLKNRSRDMHELSLEHLEVLFDKAWGSRLFPKPSDMELQFEQRERKLWKRYSGLSAG